MLGARLFFYAAIALVAIGAVMAGWIGVKRPKLPVPNWAIYALIWLLIIGLLTVSFALGGSHS